MMIYDIEKLVKDVEYMKENHLKVKKDEQTNLYVIKYDKNYLTKENISTLGCYRSVITNGEVVLSMAPPKSVDIYDFKESNKVEDCIFEEFAEGTMINCFYADNQWKIATRSVIGANCNFMQEKSFREMFFETFEERKLNWDLFNPSYSYSFVLQHPDNKIVVNFAEKNLVLVEIRKGSEKIDILLQEFQDLRNKINVPTIYFHSSGESWSDIYNLYSNCKFNILGCIVKNKMGIRSKIRNKNYEKIRKLRGNSTKLQYQYYHLRHIRKIKEFLKYYPEYNKRFLEFQNELHSWTQELFDNYRKCFIYKEKKLKEYPFPFRIQMYNLHQLYLSKLRNNGFYINKDIVKQHINSLDPAALMFLINFKNKT